MRAFRAGDADAVRRAETVLGERAPQRFLLSDAHPVVARGSGTLYPALMRLSDDGYLEQRWDVEGAKPRHMYLLSPDGVEFARVRVPAPPRPTLEAEAVA